MKKLAIVMLALLFFIQSALAFEPFCGWSTYATCTKDSDCQAGGCSGQVCGGLNEEKITTCEFKECYDPENYNLTCQCIDGKCQWGYSNKVPFAKSESKISQIKSIFFSIITFNPILLLILGTILILISKLAKFVGIILIILGLIGLVFWFI